MALDQSDLLELFEDIYENGNITLPEDPEFYIFLNEVLNKKCMPKEANDRFIERINELKLKQKDLGDHGWGDQRIEKTLPLLEQMRLLLFEPIEEVPLHINGEFSPIAKWRLSKGK